MNFILCLIMIIVFQKCFRSFDEKHCSSIRWKIGRLSVVHIQVLKPTEFQHINANGSGVVWLVYHLIGELVIHQIISSISTLFHGRNP